MDLDKVAAQLRALIRQQIPGGCRMVSQGDGCSCPLCAVDALSTALAEAKQELKDIRKLAKIESLEEVLAHKSESETAFRLRAFAAIATLRVDLLAAKSEPGLVQKVCEAAAANLVRAQDAEAKVAALTASLAQVTQQAEHEWRRANDAEVTIIALTADRDRLQQENEKLKARQG